LIIIVPLLLVSGHVPKEMADVNETIETTKLTGFTIKFAGTNFKGRIIAYVLYLNEEE